MVLEVCVRVSVSVCATCMLVAAGSGCVLCVCICVCVCARVCVCVYLCLYALHVCSWPQAADVQVAGGREAAGAGNDHGVGRQFAAVELRSVVAGQ